MNWRVLAVSILGARLLAGQSKDPVYFSWHALEYTAFDNGKRDVTFQFHFRTHNHFTMFGLVRGAVFATKRLPKRWNWVGGYLAQNQETTGDQEWARQQRVYTSISRPLLTRRLRHVPRVQYDFLFAMATPAYARYRFGWQTEWVGRWRPYAGAEEFFERAGVQRFRPRLGIRFSPVAYMEADVAYLYDRIYLRGTTNRHILQTTFNFHRPGKD